MVLCAFLIWPWNCFTTKLYTGEVSQTLTKLQGFARIYVLLFADYHLLCVFFFFLPWIVPALGCLGNRQRVTEDFAVLVPVELLTHPVSTLKPVWQPIRKRFLTLALQMLYQTAVYEEMWGFTTHFEGRREGTSLLIHSVTLLRWKGKNRQDTDGTGRISKQLLTHIQRNTDSGQCWLSVPYAAA